MLSCGLTALPGAASASNYEFLAAPQTDLNRVFRLDKTTGEVGACQYGLKEGSAIGVTLCYPPGEGAKAGAAGEYALFRREKVRIDDEADRGGTRAPILRHVTGLDVTYWDWQKQEWVPEWSTAPGERTLLPTRVRLKLTLRMPDGAERPFETQARVAIIRPLNFQ